MSNVIDFHTHILPSIDDGSSSVEETIKLLEMEKQQGIERLVLTPHFYASCDGLDRFLERRGQAIEILKDALQQRDDLPEMAVGAEVEFFEGMSDCEYLDKLSISGTRCILVEMPMKRWTDEMLMELQGIYHKQGLIPVIAHIDRYICKFRNFIRPTTLLDLPVLVQASAEFFIRSSSRRKALKMLKKDQIHLLGTDTHNLGERSPNMQEALLIIQNQLGEEAIKRINHHEDRLFAANAAQNI